MSKAETDFIENHIAREAGVAGLSVVSLVHSSGYRLSISEYGAQILSWTHPSGRELLYLSDRLALGLGKAIRGGIPLVFPQFGRGPLPAHGFARIKPWKVVREQVTDSGAVSVTLRLTPDAEVLTMWPYAFLAELDVVLSEVLVMTMRVVNGDASPFSFCSAFHTYFAVGDCEHSVVKGLKNSKFVDFLRGRQEYTEERDILTFDSPIDRAYRNSPESLVLESPNARFVITKQGLDDTVVWNPWLEGNRSMADLAEGDYLKMLCVESGNVLNPVTLNPGEIHISGQLLRAGVSG